MITIDAEQAFDELNGILLRLAAKQDLLDAIGEREAEAARQRIMSTKTDPEGDRWTRWRPSTARQRLKKGNAGRGILWDEGDLLDSIYFASSADGLASSDMSLSEVLIGTDSPIGMYQQFGTYGPGVGPSGYHVPPRPFLGWEPTAFGVYEMMAARFLAGEPL
jgi:phage gpG-like protein